MANAFFSHCSGGMDVLQTCLAPLLSLKDFSRLSQVNRHTYYTMHQRDQALYVVRQIWNIEALSASDKIKTICKTHIHRAVVCAWYLMHPKPGELCQRTHFIKHAVVKGSPETICFLTNKLDYREGGSLIFINTVVNLMKNGHLDLTWLVYSNANGRWWQQYDYFDVNDKFTCWKEAVKLGRTELEEKMATLFMEDTPTYLKKIACVRLLTGIASLDPTIFLRYYEQVIRSPLVTREEVQHLMQQAHSSIIVDALRERESNFERTQKRIAMVNLLNEKMQQRND